MLHPTCGFDLKMKKNINRGVKSSGVSFCYLLTVLTSNQPATSNQRLATVATPPNMWRFIMLNY